MFYLICFVSMCLILMEAIAASPVCHQRNAIFGRGARIFVLTHFPRRETGCNASSAAQAVPLGDTWRTIRLRMTAECRSARERSTT
jgi:hypothetical protein